MGITGLAFLLIDGQSIMILTKEDHFFPRPSSLSDRQKTLTWTKKFYPSLSRQIVNLQNGSRKSIMIKMIMTINDIILQE